MDEHEIGTTSIGRRSSALIGLAQGAALWFALEVPEGATGRMIAVVLLYAMAAGGLVLQMCREAEARRRNWLLALGFAAVFAAITLWVWWPLPEPSQFLGDGERYSTWAFATGVALFIAIPFAQTYQAIGSFDFPYTDLFRHSWNDVFIYAIGGLYALLLLVLVVLWAELFDLIGIGIFEDILYDERFYCLAYPAAFGFGLAVGRENQRVILTLRRVTLAAFRTLQPLLAAISVGFLIALAFTGLEPLWETDRPTPILLTLLALQTVFINAVFQDGSLGAPYLRPVRFLVQASLVVMPVQALIAGYSLHLRVEQYGLTPPRVWALLLITVMLLYSLAYAVGVFVRSEVWFGSVRRANIFVAWFVIALVLAAHTPALDPYRVSAVNQVRRLANGVVSSAEFDYAALRWKLGKYGFVALQAIDGPPEAVAYAKKTLERKVLAREDPLDLDRIFSNETLERVPPLGALSEALLDDINRQLRVTEARQCLARRDCLAFGIDLDGDGRREVVVTGGPDNWLRLYAFVRNDDGTWELHEIDQINKRRNRIVVLEEIRNGEFRATPRRFHDVLIGGTEHFRTR